jgi:hypothetical protein
MRNVYKKQDSDGLQYGQDFWFLLEGGPPQEDRRRFSFLSNVRKSTFITLPTAENPATYPVGLPVRLTTFVAADKGLTPPPASGKG